MSWLFINKKEKDVALNFYSKILCFSFRKGMVIIIIIPLERLQNWISIKHAKRFGVRKPCKQKTKNIFWHFDGYYNMISIDVYLSCTGPMVN